MPDHAWYTVIWRTALVFVYTYAILRLSGRHQLAQLTLFDFLVVISLGSAVGDAMIYSESTTPLLYSMLAIAVVAAIHIAAIKISERHYPLRALLYGHPRLLIKNGKLLLKNLDAEDLALDQFHSMLREKGVSDVRKVKTAYLEPTGKLSVILWK